MVGSRRTVALLVVGALGFAACGGDDDSTSPASPTNATGTSTAGSARLMLTSSAFDEGGEIPRRYTCDGTNASPPFAWSGMPDGATQLALIVVDTDAPNGNFVHWVTWGFPADDGSIAAGKVPLTAVQGKNSAGSQRYTGPCPPNGTHHYEFTLYALSGAPQVPAGATASQLRTAIDPITVASMTLTGTYAR